MPNRFRPLKLMLLAMAAQPAIALADEPPFVRHQALVRLSPSTSPEQFAGSLNAVIADSIPARDVYLLQLNNQVDEIALVAGLASDPRVVWSDLNFIADDDVPGGSTQSFFLASIRSVYDASPVPDAIDLAPAHLVSTGTGIVVAVLDSGVDAAHPLLAQRIIGPALHLVPGPGGVADVGDGLDNDNDGFIDEAVGHGTFVAGLIARAAPAAQILPIRVLDSDGNSTSFRLAQGLYLAMDHGALVVNLSLGTTADPVVLRDALLEARARNVTVVASAGNTDSQTPLNPANLAALGVIGVPAVDQFGVKAAFSNFGPGLAVSAPGVQIASLIPGGGFGTADGSSFAAPWVAGAAALLRARCPALTPDEIRERLMAESTPINALNPNHVAQLGAGMLNALRPLQGPCIIAPPACSLADITHIGGSADDPGAPDGQLTVDDLIVFVNAFGWGQGCPAAPGAACNVADVTDIANSGAGPDGQLTVDDIIAFVNAYGDGC